jgi:hypothetical protein
MGVIGISFWLCSSRMPVMEEKTVRQSDWRLARALPLFCDMSETNFE